MNTLFDKSFVQNLEKIHDAGLLKKIEKSILNIKSANNLSEITSLKKLKG